MQFKISNEDKNVQSTSVIQNAHQLDLQHKTSVLVIYNLTTHLPLNGRFQNAKEK